MRRPKRTILSVHECAGNPLKPKQAVRAVANLVWSGADLREILDEGGIDPAAPVYLVPRRRSRRIRRHTKASYLKDMPLERVATGDVLLAYEMRRTADGRAWCASPALYPGLLRHQLRQMAAANDDIRSPCGGPLTTALYNDAPPRSRGTSRDAAPRPVWEIAPESIVASALKAEIRAGKPFEVWGWAWAARGVARVEVNLDSGESWGRAKLAGRHDWSWQRFSYDWRPKQPAPSRRARRLPTAQSSSTRRPGIRSTR